MALLEAIRINILLGSLNMQLMFSLWIIIKHVKDFLYAKSCSHALHILIHLTLTASWKKVLLSKWANWGLQEVKLTQLRSHAYQIEQLRYEPRHGSRVYAFNILKFIVYPLMTTGKHVNCYYFFCRINGSKCV